MKLEFLFDIELDYAGGFAVLAPYGEREGSGYGSGGGSVSGERVNGTLRWSNHPRRREDGVLMPDAHGLIDTDDGARILFHFSGYSHPIEGAPTLRKVVSPGTFESDDDRYRWLNDVVVMAEGTIDFETLRLGLRCYACVTEVER
jgi:hypothetical protein